MKKVAAFFSVVLFVLLLALPSTSDARGGRGGGSRGGGYHGGHHGGFHGGYRGWHGPRYFVGVRPFYPWPYYAPIVPSPVYVVPPPVYGVDQPPIEQPMAYPDPNYSQQYGNEPPPGPEQQQYSQAPPESGGQWVTVPGQWVEGRWIPEHQVQVPPEQPPVNR